MNSVFWRSSPSGLSNFQGSATLLKHSNSSQMPSLNYQGSKSARNARATRLILGAPSICLEFCTSLLGLAGTGNRPVVTIFLKEPAKGPRAMGVLAKPDLPPG